MKKIIYALLCMLCVIPLVAQPVTSYDFESKVGTYEEMTGGTVVGAGILGTDLTNISFDGIVATGLKEKTTTNGIPIGFDFIFNDQPMNKFVINSYGSLIVGKDQIVVDPLRGAFILDDTGQGKENVIGLGVNADLNGLETTQISYKLIGNSPNRILVVQFKNMEFSTDYSGGKKAVSFQIRLYETSNRIEMVFKDWRNESTSSKDVRLGIRGYGTDAHRRTSAGDWTNTEKKIGSIKWKSGCYPADGLTYIFTMSQTCEKPSAQPTALKLESTSVMVKGSFTATETADHYLVLVSEQQNLSLLPENKKMYNAGDMIGNATVVTYTTDLTFETEENLSGAKSYYFHLFATNSFCSYGPIYNTTSPLTGTIKTLPDMPQSFSVKGEEYESIVLSATANQAGDKIMIAMTDVNDGEIEGFPSADGIFGVPSGIMNVGDMIKDGGKVVYKGDAKSDIKIENLNNNTTYYFMVWSIDAANNYSSTSIQASANTWGRLPYRAYFGKNELYSIPLGWDQTGNVFRTVRKNNNNKGNEAFQLECNVTALDPINGKENTLATQWIMLNNATNRLIFNCNLTYVSGRVSLPYKDWEENDVLEVQVSKDGISYTPVYTINKENAPQMATIGDWAKLNIPFDQFKGEKVKIRLRWKTYSKNAVKLMVENFVVEEKPICEYPTNISVDATSVVGDQALISWTSGGEENAWDIRFRKVGTEKWTEPVEVRTNPSLVTKLPSSSDIELQVRAKCSLTSMSPWSKSLIFKSGYGVPFSESFDANTLPTGWSFESGLLSDSTEFCTGGMSCVKYWKIMNNIARVTYSSRPKDWLLTPKIDLGDGSYHANLEFDLKIVKSGTNPIPEDIIFAVVVADNESLAFREENVLLKLQAADFSPVENKHYSVNLAGHKGIVKIGFYAYSKLAAGTSDTEQLYLDNISLVETCPAAINVDVTDVTPATATVRWEGESDEWLTFIRQAGSTKKDYQKHSKSEWSLSGLTPKTNYEVGITKACAQNDTARVVLASFTTQSLAPCLVPSNISVVASQRFVTLSWEGEGMSYNVRIRESGTEEWINKTTQTTSIKIDGLETGTEYEYSLQSVCSAAQGDMSAWTAVSKVNTLAVTCFAPADLAAFATYKYTTVSWSGEADKYQLQLREEGKNWVEYLVNGGETYMLNDLSTLTKYSIRMRSICAVGDTSVWSAVVDFKTPDVPVCAIPSNLVASGISDTSATLTWDADESNLSWDLRYREGSVTNWVTKTQLTEKRYELTGLKDNTLYLWSVKATCDEGRTSAWAAQQTFNTQASGIANIDGSGLRTFVSNGMINVVNPSGSYIKSIRLFSIDGKILKEFTVNSDENILIPVNLDASTVIMKVYGENIFSSYTLVLK